MLEVIWDRSPCVEHGETGAVDSREVGKLVRSNRKGDRFKKAWIDQARGSVLSNDVVTVARI